MPHVSRHKLGPKAEKELVDKLCAVLAHINSHEDMQMFLFALLTPTEQIMLAKRLAMIILINEGLPDSRIAISLRITRITVAKMRYFYESRGTGFTVALKTLQRMERFEEFKDMLLSLARYSARAAGGRVNSRVFD